MACIQKATVQDIPVIQQLARESWLETYRSILSEGQIEYMLEMMYNTKTLTEQVENPHFHYLLYRQDNSAVGFCGFELHESPSTTKLHRIYIPQRFQGQGIGRVLVKAVEDAARTAFDAQVILQVNKENPAKQFYHTLGFVVIQEAVFQIGNGYVMDDYIMCKEIR